MVPEEANSLLPPVNSVSGGGVAPSSLGFVSPDHTRDCSPALQLQMALLTADKKADYFLFDESDRPVRFEIQDTILKMTFRLSRSVAWSENRDTKAGVETIAQYLIKVMGHRPGLSRERIFRQFDSEYGGDTKTKLEEFERNARGRTHDGETVLEMMNRNVVTGVPLLNARQ
jgi:hypothetical protein